MQALHVVGFGDSMHTPPSSSGDSPGAVFAPATPRSQMFEVQEHSLELASAQQVVMQKELHRLVVEATDMKAERDNLKDECEELSEQNDGLLQNAEDGQHQLQLALSEADILRAELHRLVEEAAEMHEHKLDLEERCERLETKAHENNDKLFACQIISMGLKTSIRACKACAWSRWRQHTASVHRLASASEAHCRTMARCLRHIRHLNLAGGWVQWTAVMNFYNTERTQCEGAVSTFVRCLQKMSHLALSRAWRTWGATLVLLKFELVIQQAITLQQVNTSVQFGFQFTSICVRNLLFKQKARFNDEVDRLRSRHSQVSAHKLVYMFALYINSVQIYIYIYIYISIYIGAGRSRIGSKQKHNRNLYLKADDRE
jgi:hypothetical protein